MRIALLYPPPWKMSGPAESIDYGVDGPPEGYRDGDLDGDFYQVPYGLLSLAAQARRAGHQVELWNLSAHPWSIVQRVVSELDAQLFGLSCWTANRRGAISLAECIRGHHPEAHIVVGGPHATPLAEEMLAHCAAIDTVAVGESEQTFIELTERLAAGSSCAGLAGAVVRVGADIERGGPRAPIANLDSLAPVHDYFDTHILMTSRGCPWACTFCGAESQWGRGYRGHSVGYVLDTLERALERLPVKMILVKDDTFTTQRQRVIELCRGIRDRKLRFMWSCDTRVDLLNEELLREMRLAGCERLSLGVESGAPAILRKIDKKITTDDIIRTTELAKKYGIAVRYYMMLGNRGETVETFQQTLDFLKAAEPHEYIFSCLSVYPGTLDFHDAERLGWLDRELFFTETFQELKTPFDASEQCTEMMDAWFFEHSGLQVSYRPGIVEHQATLALLGEHHAAHLDLGAAYFHQGMLSEAEHHVRRALQLGHPLPGLAHNYLACIAVERGDFDAMMNHYSEAARCDPQHDVLVRNVAAARAWFKQGGPARKLPLELAARHDFRLLERTVQPMLPGPLPDDIGAWDAAPPGAEQAAAPDRSAEQSTSNKQLKVIR